MDYRHDHLPHIQVPGATYFITFRTHNFRILSQHAREIALTSIHYWNKQRLILFEAVVMPDHVHLIAKPLKKDEDNYWDLSVILHSIKSFSANEINRIEGTVGSTVWQSERYDRVIRDINELAHGLEYITLNPIKAGLVEADSGESYAYLYHALGMKGDEWKEMAMVMAGWKPAQQGKIN